MPRSDTGTTVGTLVQVDRVLQILITLESDPRTIAKPQPEAGGNETCGGNVN